MRWMIVVFAVLLFSLPVGAQDDTVTVTAVAETVESSGDGATGVIVWVHPIDPAQSLIIGTDKRAGLVTYTLTGEAVQVVELGRVNNVDVRQNVLLGGQVYDIAAATNRTTGTLDLFILDRETGQITPAGAFVSQVEEVYGDLDYNDYEDGCTRMVIFAKAV